MALAGRSVTVFGILTLAGCLQDPPPPPAIESTEWPAKNVILAWSLDDCDFAVGHVPVTASRLQEKLPEGFRLIPRAGRTPLDPAATNFGFEAFRCLQGDTLNSNQKDVSYGAFWTRVTPPPQSEASGVKDYYYKWEVIIPDEDRRAVLVSHNQSVRGGVAKVVLAPASAGQTVDAWAEFAGLGRLEIKGYVNQAVNVKPGTFREYTGPAADRIAFWDANFTVDSFSLGRALVQFPAGSWASDLVGGRPVQADIWAGNWSFQDATITLPAKER